MCAGKVAAEKHLYRAGMSKSVLPDFVLTVGNTVSSL
jgi:hypothetical protein